MKKYFIIISGLLFVLSYVFATQMIVHTSTGDTSFELDNINSITFSNGLTDFVWITKAEMTTVRANGMTAVVEDIIYTINGSEGQPGTGRIVEAYDVIADSWSTKATYPRPEGRSGQGVAVINEEIYVFGGTNIWGTYYTNTVDKYNATTDNWTLDVSTYPSLISHSMCATVDNYIYCIGGIEEYPGASITNKIYKFNPNSGSFTELTDMPTARCQGIAIPLGNNIYVIGGYDGSGQLDVLEIYDVSSDTWSIGDFLPIGIKSTVGGTINGKIYTASGYIDGDVTNRVFEYNPYQDIWTEKEHIQYERSAAFGGIVNNKFYVIGGTDESGAMPGSAVNYTEEGTLVLVP